MGAIVTLGTPHRVTPVGWAGRHLAVAATDFADRVVPGPAFAPTTGYLTVASRTIAGRLAGHRRERVAYGLYRSIHAAAASGDVIQGDGLVPVESAWLPGVETIVLQRVAHGQSRPGPWYGSDAALDAWWPRAIAVWRAALRARLEGPVV
jgi:hypothetical protein